MKILANDGISASGASKLRENGFEVSTENIPKGDLIDYINQNNIVGILVRSATTVRKELIDACPSLKLIGRGGVGMDNIDVSYARSKGIIVINTPAASSQSVAELVMGNLFSLSRYIYDANRQMPTSGNSEFKNLKKAYSKGQELRGKTLGIVGFGRIGQSLAAYALGVGMKVVAVDVQSNPVQIPINIAGVGNFNATITPLNNLNEVIGELDYLSLHVPKQANGDAVINEENIKRLKEGVIIVNAARGGVIDEKALLQALDSGKIAAAALDVFDNEPTPNQDLLSHPKIAATPHIGAATLEAQNRIGEELADQIIKHLK